MTVITKGVNKAAQAFGRSATFSSAASDFGNGDTLDLYTSFGYSPKQVTFSVDVASSCSFRINSLNRRYPLSEDAKRMGYHGLDLSQETVWFNEEAPAYSLTAGETFVINSIPVSSIEFTALVGTVIVTAIG